MLGKVIGAGSMGKVRLATKEESTEQVACKIIPRYTTDDGHMSRAEKERADQSKEIRTAREAAIVTLLNHPYICGLRDVVRTNHHWYMLFEYVNGGQMLDYIISHGKLKEKPARKFSRQIASALDYCHRNSIVHRDLKIENILISKTGDIKIIDFGLSNLFAPRGHLRTFCGSLYFAAPELLQARAYTGPEVDVWSFGIVLYVLVCGKVPFDDQSIPALHSKIKKGLVDYPTWLSAECKQLLSRMLVTDPRMRATMHEVMNHPWMLKGYNGPPENYLPRRDPITLPLEPEVITAMTGFNFGTPETITAQLTRVIESDEYQRSVRLMQKEKDQQVQPVKDAERKRGFNLDFYKRRNSTNSRDALNTPSTEGLPMGNDPLNAFNPLVSVYYLVREKQERDRLDHLPPSAKDKGPIPIPEIAPPPTAYTNSSTYEYSGEKATGGRTRPRARTHGEDDVPDIVKGKTVAAAAAAGGSGGGNPGLLSPTHASYQDQYDAHKKESTAAGILRRFSTRRKPKEPERVERADRDRSHPPVVQVHSPSEQQHPTSPTPLVPRKSFSIRRSRRDQEDSAVPRVRSGSSQPQHSELLSPPLSAGASNSGYKKGLGRSTSVSSAEYSRRRPIGGSASRIINKEPPTTSGSDHSTINDRMAGEQRNGSNLHGRSVSLRTKPLSHARMESIQARRSRLEEERSREANVPEETDAEIGDQSGVSNERLTDFDLDKPVYFKGLFSVLTTSTKPVREMRADIRRVLKQLGVEYVEIKGGFSCRHSPSIDLNKVAETPSSPPPPMPGQGHRRRFSFGLRSGEQTRDEVRENVERGPTTPRTPGRHTDIEYSDVSDGSDPRLDTARPVPAGETTTHVRSDMGGDLVLEFEIFIVKIPVVALHGVQFKRLGGNTWQYKNMADQILRDLRL